MASCTRWKLIEQFTRSEIREGKSVHSWVSNLRTADKLLVISTSSIFNANSCALAQGAHHFDKNVQIY
jgi:hypothetical protein